MLNHLPMARTLIVCLLLALLPIAAGCGSSGQSLVDVSASERQRDMPESVTAWGFYYVDGPRLFRPSSMNMHERAGLADAQRTALYAVAGTRYEMNVTNGESAIRVVTAGDIVNTEVVSRDAMRSIDGEGNWLVTCIKVPFLYNEAPGIAEAVTTGPGFKAVVRVPPGSHLGTRFVPVMAIEAALKEMHTTDGTYSGTAFVLRCEPRVERLEVEEPDAKRWMTRSGVSMRSKNADELAFDVEVVICEGFVPGHLSRAELEPIENKLPVSGN